MIEVGSYLSTAKSIAKTILRMPEVEEDDQIYTIMAVFKKKKGIVFIDCIDLRKGKYELRESCFSIGKTFKQVKIDGEIISSTKKIERGL